MTGTSLLSGLRTHLVESRLAGAVATTPGNTLDNCRKLVDGEAAYTFGLSDWRTADFAEARSAVAAVCGDEAVDGDPEGPGWIDPDATVEAVEGHRARIAAHARARSAVLLATGHPTGLLGHYVALARRLDGAGCRLLMPLDDDWVVPSDGQRRRGVRFVGGVGCVRTGGDLLHSHFAIYMEAMLDSLESQGMGPDLVIGDHGMAGTAVERGIETLGIADVNDPALFLAQARGRTRSVVPIDDNLAPRLYEPMTAAMLDGLGA